MTQSHLGEGNSLADSRIGRLDSLSLLVELERLGRLVLGKLDGPEAGQAQPILRVLSEYGPEGLFCLRQFAQPEKGGGRSPTEIRGSFARRNRLDNCQRLLGLTLTEQCRGSDKKAIPILWFPS